MSTVIGLFQQNERMESSIDKLQQAGFTTDKISILTRADAVKKLLENPQSHATSQCVLCGALLGFGLFGLLSLVRITCQCFSSLPMGLELQIFTFVFLTGLGTAFGALFGSLVAADKSERNTHLYSRGVCCGYKLLAVKGSGEPVAAAVRLLQEERAIGVRVIPNRS